MYIIELIFNGIKNLKQKVNNYNKKSKTINIENDISDQDCQHLFMPIDSTNKTFACTKCGKLIHYNNIEKKSNFFRYLHRHF